MSICVCFLKKLRPNYYLSLSFHRSNFIDCIMLKLKRILGCTLRHVEDNGQSTIFAAINRFDAEMVSTLLYAGVDITSCDYDQTPLHVAAFSNQEDIVKMLIEGGADINATDNLGNTSVRAACLGKSVECVDLLCKAGCDVNMCDKLSRVNYGQTAVSLTLRFLLNDMEDTDDEIAAFQILEILHTAGLITRTIDIEEEVVSKFVHPQFRRILSNLLCTDILPLGPKTLKVVARNKIREELTRYCGNIYAKVCRMGIDDNPMLKSLILEQLRE